VFGHGVEMTNSTPSADALKLNFDMTKQVMSTTATVVTLLVIYLKASGSAQSSTAPAIVTRFTAVLLLISLLLGMLCMGRQIANMEDGKLSTQEGGMKWLGIGQHGSFILGMIGVLVLVFVAG
jgi:hypothetical protein